jgi:Fe-S-cluster-containing hydrogenase component 2
MKSQHSTSTVTVATLNALPIFSPLAAPAIDRILTKGQVHQLKPRQRISALARKEKESYCFVLSGQVAVVLDRSGGKKVSSENEDLEFIGSFAPGEFFSNGYLDCAEGNVTLDCIATTAVVLLTADVPTLTELMQQSPAWASRLAHEISLSRSRFLSQQEPTRRFVQDFYLRQGFASTKRIRVSEMIRCIDCDKCQQACAMRHGKARMVRAHSRLGRLAFQQFCLQCTDQACLAACAFGAMSKDPKGEIRIEERCEGCGACARKCPHGAIYMVDVPYTLADFPHPVPSSNDNGLTHVPGLFVAGDVRGPGSIKLAMHEARRAVDNMPPRRSGREDRRILDVIVVGAGTAGLAGAQRCSDRQLDFIVLEKNPALSEKAARSVSQLRIQSGKQVERITPLANGLLSVETNEGAYHAENVLVCTGKPTSAAGPTGSASPPMLLGHVQILEPGTKEMEAYATMRGTHQTGIKCDNCSGYADRACIRACPTGCLVEMPANDLFMEPSEFPDQNRRNFSGVAFVEGIPEQRARQKKHRTANAIFSALLMLALVAIGLECFLRATMPEHSVEGMIRAWLGSHDPVWYSSGKGFGHWLGYVGAAFMLLTLFYPLRTRCGVLKGWGAQSTWLTVHLWVGFIGATLVTYHAAFKLDRWMGLACYAMWIVILSGAIGRYLYGMVHSGIGLVEFEREALTRSTASLAAEQNLGARVQRFLSDQPGKTGHLFSVLLVMLWQELHDFSFLIWVRFTGLSHIQDRRTRRQTLQYLSDIASHRRARRFLESAKRLLRYWNWVHIILTISMFILAGFHITYGFMYKAV